MELVQRVSDIADDPAMPLAGVSVLALRDGQVVAEAQAGFRYIDSADTRRSLPLNADTLCRVASISKLITAIGAMVLVEQGLLHLDSDVSDVLGFPLRHPGFGAVPVTLRMLMSHTSSLCDDAGYSFDATTTLRAACDRNAGRMWLREYRPGTYFQYANLPWGVIGTMMERAAGERFDRLMRRLVLDPLKIDGGFEPAEFPIDQQRNIATLYRKRVAGESDDWNPAGPWVAQTDDFAGRPIAPRDDGTYLVGTNGTLFGPQGSCRASARGLARVGQLLLNEGELDGARVLRPQTVREMLREQWRSTGTNGNTGGEFARQPTLAMNSWGLGVQRIADISEGRGRGDRVIPQGGYAPIGHFGDAYGLTSALLVDSATRSVLVAIVTGVGQNPATTPGAHSAMARYEERLLTLLHDASMG